MAGKFAAWSVRPRLVSFALGTSVLAIAAGASPASAQCAPDPTSVNGTTTCTGVDTDGLSVPTSGTRVIVQPNATVLAGSNAAGITTAGTFIGSTATLAIEGTVLGGAGTGVSATVTNSYYGYLGPCDPYAGASVGYCGSPYGVVSPSNATAISIGTAGTISGTSAIRLQANPNNNAGILTASVVNAGTLTGTSGAALVADSGTYFTQVTNQAGGTIDGISGVTRSIDNAGTINRGIAVGTPTNFAPGAFITNSGTINGGIAGTIQLVRNTGTIDGSTGSAIAAKPVSTYQYFQLNNDGRVTSNGTAATVTSAGGANVQNTGRIVNAGTGAAIEANGFLSVTNTAGATIGSAGAVAIRNTGLLNLVNAGTIDGSVVSTGVANQYATIDITKGLVDGDLLLGASNDTVSVRFDVATGRIGSITGRIDAGSGIDTLNLGIDGDTTLTAATIPASFERLGLTLTDAAVTLANGLQLPNGVTATGSGSLVNAATLVTTGQAITTSASYPGTLSLINTGTITADVTNSYGAAVSAYSGEFTNSGTITAIGGGGVNVTNYNSPKAITNSGTITASGYGALVYSGALTNSGTIRSTGNIGAIISGSQSDAVPSTNSGLIDGATSGVSLSFGTFVNTGTVTGGATGNGAGVDITYYGIVDNQAGGTISGATGISGRNGYTSTVLNAGTINGGVDFASGSTYDQSSDVFVDNGGVVNGAIRLGGGNDMLVMDLVQPTGRALGGATGGVDAGDGFDTITYRVGTDATTQIVRPTGFEGIGYELANGAALTLTSASPLATTLSLSGTGKVDVTADITQANVPLIDMTALTVAQRLRGSNAVANDLDVISHGTLTASFTDPYLYQGIYAVNAGAGRFENAGTISVAGATSEYSYYSAAAIVGSGTVINSGTITLAGAAYGISAPTVINSGSIQGAVGSKTIGVYAQSLQNSGSIVTDGVAVASNYYVSSQILNTGRIESRQDTALLVYEGSSILNDTGGVIQGSAQAILGYGTTVINRGAIVGDVYLGSYPGYSMSQYVADGGTLTGALIFGEGNDVFTQTGAATGVSGVIDGGDGTDQVVLAGTGTGSFAGANNFERLDVISGDWTLTAASSFANGTGIAAGATLAGTTTTLTGDIADAGTLRIDQATNGLFGATLTGTGALVKIGTGNVTIGDQLGFTGTTSIRAGRLSLAGTLPSAVTVQSGGTLGGNGTVASATIANGGTIAPGNSIGTITIAGNFVQQAGSTYAAEIDTAGRSDRILVGGTATLQSGARLAITGTAATIGTRYTLLTAAGGVTGSYAVTQSAAGGTELRLGYSGTAVFGDVARTGAGLVAVARTTNQRSVASAFGALGTGNAAYTALTLVPNGDTVAGALDMLTGEIHASLRTAMVRDAQIVEGAVLSRTLSGDQPSGLWGTVLANSGKDDGSIDAAAVDRDTIGGVGGFDIAIGPQGSNNQGSNNGRIGIAGGYTRTKLTVDGRASTAKAKTIHLLGYAGGAYGAIRLRAGIGYAWADTRTDRFVAFPGFADRLQGDYNGDTFHGFAEAGYAVPLGGGSVQPFAGIQAFRIHTDGVAESGGATALTVAPRSESFAFASAGLRFDTPVVGGLSARGVTAWQRRIDGVAPTSAARFSAGQLSGSQFSGGTSTFDIAGVPLSRDAMTAGIDIVWAPTATIRVSSGYAGLIGSRGTDSTVKLTASIGF